MKYNQDVMDMLDEQTDYGETKKCMHLGRNILEDDGRYYLVLNWERDLTSSHDKGYIRSNFDTHRKAVIAMNKYLKNGATWFNAHYDPSLTLTSF